MTVDVPIGDLELFQGHLIDLYSYRGSIHDGDGAANRLDEVPPPRFINMVNPAAPIIMA